MQNVLPLTLLLFLVSTTFYSIAAQNTKQLSLKAELGYVGIEKESTPDVGGTLLSQNLNGSLAFALGVEKKFSIGTAERFSAHVSLLYNYQRFSRTYDYLFASSSGSDDREIKDQQNFQNHFLSLPLELQYNVGDWSVGAGFAGVFHLFTRVENDIEVNYPNSPMDNYSQEINFRTGEELDLATGIDDFVASYRFWKQIEAQYFLALYWTVSPKWKIGGVYYNWLAKNRVSLEYRFRETNELAGSVFDFNARTNSLKLVVSYSL